MGLWGWAVGLGGRVWLGGGVSELESEPEPTSNSGPAKKGLFRSKTLLIGLTVLNFCSNSFSLIIHLKSRCDTV